MGLSEYAIILHGTWYYWFQILRQSHPAIDQWRAGWEARLTELVRSGNWAELHVCDPAVCLKAFNATSVSNLANFTVDVSSYQILYVASSE